MLGMFRTKIDMGLTEKEVRRLCDAYICVCIYTANKHHPYRQNRSSPAATSTGTTAPRPWPRPRPSESCSANSPTSSCSSSWPVRPIVLVVCVLVNIYVGVLDLIHTIPSTQHNDSHHRVRGARRLQDGDRACRGHLHQHRHRLLPGTC